MVRKLIMVTVVVALIFLVLGLPDIKRFIKIREM
jgi:hypothetical protein